MREKRRHRRIIKRLDTDCTAGGVDFRGISSCLSGNGLFVRTSKPFPPDTPVDLRIHLSDNIVSRVRGVVRTAARTGLTYGKNGMGIEIVECDQNFVTFMNSLLPVEEHIRNKEHGVDAVPAIPREKPAALPQDSTAAHPRNETSPRPKKCPEVSPKREDAETEETIDSLLSSLFPKGDKK
jgi:hypothetical protein